jgi:thioredoxin reductase
VTVVVIGAGPAGLSAAIELRRLGVGPVLVADRETEAGGVPRHCFHTGFGLRDRHRVMTGPAYARALAAAAVRAGAELRLGTTVTCFDAAHAVTLTSGRGVETVRAAAVLLATGCRERPRAARLIPGDRPAGVMTTGELQQRVYLGHERLAGRALVVGAEHVSFSAAVTLAHAGARVVALVTEYERQQSYAAFRLGAALRWRVPVWTGSAIGLVTGRGRLAGVEVADVRTGAARFVPCEVVVFTGDWIPDHELARRAGLAMDPGTRGPVVDTRLETSAPGVFASGNLVHAAETADIAALSGRHAARHIAAALGAGGPDAAGPGAARPDAGTGAGRVPIRVEPPLRWISPNAIASAASLVPPPLGRFVLRSQEFRRLARLEVRQDGRLLARSRVTRLVPERPVHLRAAWLARVDPAGGPVRVISRGAAALRFIWVGSEFAGGAGDDRTGRPQDGRGVGPRSSQGVAGRPRGRDRRAQGRVRCGPADRRRARGAGRPGVRRGHPRGPGRDHRRHPGRPGPGPARPDAGPDGRLGHRCDYRRRRARRRSAHRRFRLDPLGDHHDRGLALHRERAARRAAGTAISQTAAAAVGFDRAVRACGALLNPDPVS